MSSLLAHLYNRIKGSQEDVATMSLAYILNNSKPAKKAFLNRLANLAGIENYPDLYFETQRVGDKKERSDLCGYNDNREEVIICEAKFWAGLTVNQPNAYLERLRNNTVQNKALFFICPHDRIPTLWAELLRLTEVEVNSESFNKNKVVIDNVTLAIVSWRLLINDLYHSLAEENSPLLSDLKQLKGFCELIDKESFQPFEKSDFGIDKAMRIVSYYSIVDKITDKIKIRLKATSKGLRATPQYAAYSRYLSYKNFGISVRFSCKYWTEYAETPFWLTINKIQGNGWGYAEEARNKLGQYENSTPKMLYVDSDAILIPIYVPCYAPEDVLIEKSYNIIKKVLDIISN